jgi:hypothetical protein
MTSKTFRAALLAGCGWLASLLMLSPAQGFAAECRSLNSVQDSGKSPGQNTKDGGHLAQHIKGATPPKGLSQDDKTLFTSEEEYRGIWRNYLKAKNLPTENCSGSQAFQVVKVSSLLGSGKDKIGSVSCTDADKDGKCTRMTKSQSSKVAFGFVLQGNTWILNTAYPTN